MRVGIACLALAYVLSQFYRAFLAVLTPDLQADLGATAGDLATASGVWFLAFALMQPPVGALLDRWGPRRTAATILGLAGGGGALLFAAATTPLHVTLAMALIGVGCSPVLMAAYLIVARAYPPAAFAALAGAIVGLGSLGNILSAAPLAALVEAVGWRPALVGLALATALVAGVLWLAVTDPPAPPAPAGATGSLLDLLRMGALWPVLLMMAAAYGPAASVRGLWAGPWARDLHGAGTGAIGWVTLGMGLCMVAGSFAYGAADRLLGTRKWAVWGGNAVALLALLALALLPGLGLGPGAVLLGLLGFCGAAFPLVMAHGRAFLPAHLTGRGVTLINMFGIGGAGLLQVASRSVHGSAETPEAAFRALFLFFAAVVAVGLLAYLPARDRTD